LQIKTETRVGLFVLAAIAVFIYMGFSIGVFRFDAANYTRYTIYFNDVSGLSAKADVKIAGVKVGWVELIELAENDQAKAEIMVHKKYTLYEDAYAVVRQDGLLGTKYLELVSGDPLLPRLEAGQTLSKPSKPAVSVDKLLSQAQVIASNIEDVSASFKDVLGGDKGREQLEHILENISQAVTKFASFAETIDRSITRNEEKLDTFLAIGDEFRDLSRRLSEEVFPALKESMEKISGVFDRDFNRIATRLESTASALEDASIQARDGLRSVGSVAGKIDDGKGLLGKLVNEDETYRDLKIAVEGVKNYFAKIDSLQVVIDTHFESMYRYAEHWNEENGKGYFDIRIHPQEDYFYLIQLVGDLKGSVYRDTIYREWYSQRDSRFNLNELTMDDHQKLRFAPKIETQIFRRNTLKFGLQFGRIFSNIAFRFGIFESYAGAAIDVEIPFDTEKFRWVTSLEAFDFRGWNRYHDRRPHIKWINKVYFLRNLYFAFGADDFISKHNTNAFFGGGIRFGDDDLKYFFSGMGGMARMGN
jgi:phospholipid/cholesterol/gamma-HCH transport system substrate-binding protein